MLPKPIKIRHFNAGRLNDSELEESFIARGSLFQKILRQVTSEATDSIPQHHLIIGQRGMGKTTLLCRVGVELRKIQYSKDFLPLQFPEEQYVEVDRLSKFWLNCLDALADALESDNQKNGAAELDTKIREVERSGGSEDAKSTAALQLLDETSKILGRRIVLLIDNINQLFERLADNAHDLRAFLMREGAPILIGASTLMPEESGDYNTAFYDAFKIRVLHNLTKEEMIDVIVHLAETTGQPELASRIHKETARLSTLRDLTGGNPRTTVLLFELFSKGFTEDPYEDLEGILDYVTPLYQSRLGELPDQGQLVIGHLAQHWSPSGAAEITEETGLPRGSISTQLSRLESVGLVEKVELSKGKRPGYQIAERFFNIWYLMRFATRRRRTDLICLTHFLTSFYSHDERLKRAQALLKDTDLKSGALTYALALAGTDIDSNTAFSLKTHAESLIVRLGKGIPEKISALIDPAEIPSSVYNFEETRNLFIRASSNIREINTEDFVEKSMSCILSLPPQSPNRFEIADALLKNGLAAEYDKQLKETEKQFSNDLSAESWSELSEYIGSGILTNLSDETEIIRFIDSAKTSNALTFAIDLAKQIDPEIRQRGYRRAIELDEDAAYPWNGLGNIFATDHQNYDEAANAFKKSIELQGNVSVPYSNLAKLTVEHYGDYAEAERLYKRAIEANPDNPSPKAGLGYVLSVHLDRPDEAIQAYKESLEIDSKNAGVWRNLANLLSRKPDSLDGAEKAYYKAIQYESNPSTAWALLGNLLSKQDGRRAEAEEAYRNGMDNDPSAISPLNCFGNFLLDYEGALSRAEAVFRKAIDIGGEDSVASNHNLLFLFRDFRDEQSSARSLFATFDELPKVDGFHEINALHRCLFASRQSNWSEASEHLAEALSIIDGQFPTSTHDDWQRTAAILLHQGFGKHVLKLLEQHGWDSKLMPWFEAIRAHEADDSRLLLDIPKEAQEVAGKIFDEIALRRKWLPGSTRNIAE